MKNQIIKFSFIKDYQFLVASINAASIYFFEINKGNTNIVRNLFKVDNKKVTRTLSSIRYLYCEL